MGGPSSARVVAAIERARKRGLVYDLGMSQIAASDEKRGLMVIDQTPTKLEVDRTIAESADCFYTATRSVRYRAHAMTLGEARAAVKFLLGLGVEPYHIRVVGRGLWLRRSLDSNLDSPIEADDKGFAICRMAIRWAKVRAVAPDLRPTREGWVEVEWVTRP